MQLEIKHPDKNEKFVVDIYTSEIEGQKIYKVTFLDERLSDMYGAVTIKRNSDNFWKFPENVDSFLISLVSETIFQIMDKEVMN